MNVECAAVKAKRQEIPFLTPLNNQQTQKKLVIFKQHQPASFTYF